MRRSFGSTTETGSLDIWALRSYNGYMAPQIKGRYARDEPGRDHPHYHIWWLTERRIMARMFTARFRTNQAARQYALKWKADHGGFFIQKCDLPCPVKSISPAVKHRDA